MKWVLKKADIRRIGQEWIVELFVRLYDEIENRVYFAISRSDAVKQSTRRLVRVSAHFGAI